MSSKFFLVFFLLYMRLVTVADVLLEAFHFARYHMELGTIHSLLVCLVGSNYKSLQ